MVSYNCRDTSCVLILLLQKRGVFNCARNYQFLGDSGKIINLCVSFKYHYHIRLKSKFIAQTFPVNPESEVSLASMKGLFPSWATK